MELAEQLVDPSNPLFARVMVNRVWHHLFGRGIVGTVDNFGWLGDRPSHPELLDQLAFTFVHDDHWSLKRLIRRLVLSRTFGMSSRSSDAHAEQLDPTDQVLHRMRVRRLEAESIRDSVLAVSGRLDPTLFGPPLPVHLTEFVVGRGRPSKSGPLDGGGRRSIYTSVRRNFLPTIMLTFDTPIPFSTVGCRNVTNVPGQTLALMNDPFLYEQATVWAERICRELPESQSADRVDWIYRQAFGRSPVAAERQACLDSLKEFATAHEIPPNDVLVWADLCHTMFRVSEFIYIR